MSVFISALVALLPNVFIAVFSKVLTNDFLQAVLERVIIYALKKVAPLTSNTLDDELVALVASRLKDRTQKDETV